MARRFLSLSADSVNVATYQAVTTEDLPVGGEGQVLTTVSDQAVWQDLPAFELDDVPPGAEGQLLATVSGAAAWQDPHVFELADVPTGTEGQVLTTVSDSAVWQDLPDFTLSDIPVGTENQVLTTVSGSATWQDLPPDEPVEAGDIVPGSAHQLLVTNSAGTATGWASTIRPQNIYVQTYTSLSGNLVLNGIYGTTGQVIKKTGPTAQAWSTLTAGDIQAGLANAVLMTNSAGTANEMTVTPDFPLLSVGGLPLQLSTTGATTTAVRYATVPGGTGSVGTTDVEWYRSGNIVTVHVYGFSVSWSNASDTRLYISVPSTYRPNSGTPVAFYVPATVNGVADTLIQIAMPIGTTSTLRIYRDTDGNNFPSGTTNTLVTRDYTFTWGVR